MKTRSLFPKLFLAWSILLFCQIVATAASETNSQLVGVSASELGDLREQVTALQNSNQEAGLKWDALIKQNSALSNRLAGLHQTLLTQQEREFELQKQTNSFNLKVMAGAAGAVFLVIFLSFWFQLRCFNRAVEISRSLPAGQLPTNTLIENGRPSDSKLLDAVKLLENRLQQLEAPPASPVAANGDPGDFRPTRTTQPNLASPGFVEANSGFSNISLLLAKGQMLLDMNRLEEAVGTFQEALTIDAANEEAHLKKGIALERLNRLELSLTSYDEALRLNPKRTVAYLYKARVLQGLQRYDEALSVYESALNRKYTVKSGPAPMTIAGAFPNGQTEDRSLRP